jgi:putative aminopeptidase FrvX
MTIMTDILPFLKSLISVAGLSGYEDPVLKIIRREWTPLVDETSISRIGSLHALKRGSGAGKRPAIMIATHMDAIGLIVSSIVEGVMHVEEIGGVDARILPGTPVIVHGKRELPGVVAMPPLQTLPEDKRAGPIRQKNLIVDVGFPAEIVRSLVEVGDLISFDTMPVELAGETISGHTLDNRASVAALTICLGELKKKNHAWDVWAVATVQEEETYGGAATSAFQLQPLLAVAIDVTHAKGPGSENWQTVGLGKGPAIGWGANLHPFLYRRLEEIAKKLEIPFSMDLSPEHSGTDAYAMQVAREGIPSALLSIPLRYMHTPVEVIAVRDVQRVGRLLAEFISGLQLDFMATIDWEEKDADK